MKYVKLFLMMMLLITADLFAEAPIGSLKGRVTELERKVPLMGVIVEVMDTSYKTITNEKGEFTLESIPVGSYRVRFFAQGFETIVRTDVHVRSQRITFLELALKTGPVYTRESVTVEGGYFHETEAEPHSTVILSSEEVRRSAGTAGDLGRLLKVLPATVSMTDQRNDLIVRGGSPAENAYYVDNIEIPNINQFPQMGSSGGTISMINSDLLQNVDFYTGGFSAVYGDRLSSVVDMTFREGNHMEFDGQMDLNMGGFGGGFEGPINGGKGSWLISGRRSYMDVILKILGKGFVPSYGDVHGKLNYNLSPTQKLTVLDIFGTSYLDFEKEDSIDEGRSDYGVYKSWQNTLGVNLLSLWSDRFYSNTTLSYSHMKTDSDSYRVLSDAPSLQMEYQEGWLSFRNVNYLTLNTRNKVRFGFGIKQELTRFDFYYPSYVNAIGNTIPGKAIDDNFTTAKFSAHASYTWNPFNWLTATFGLRGDYFTFNDRFHVSPRFSLNCRVNKKLAFNAGMGVFFQSVPLFFLAQDEGLNQLNDPKAVHYIAGLEYFITPTTKMTFEVYDKEYSNQPIDPEEPYFFITDRTTMQPVVFHNSLIDTGVARSYGVELMVQKKLKEKFYGIFSASYFRSRYRDYYGTWRDRMYDNRFLMTLVGGYKPDKNWEFSVNWTYLGGAPFTPIDEVKSLALNEYVLDTNRVNGERYPAYNSLNLRIERRFYFIGSSLIVYLDAWNLFNRENVFQYYWDQVKKEVGTRYQFSILPIIGIEFEF